MVSQVVGKAAFLAAGSGIPRSKLIFTMSGLNAGDDKMDLRVNDRFYMTFGDVQIGSLAGAPPGSDFVRMDVRHKPRSTAVSGEPFDSVNARFSMVKARYRLQGSGFLTVVASGGYFDPALLPQPGADGTGTGTITVGVHVERQESGETIEILYYHELSISVKRVPDGNKGRILRLTRDARDE